MDVRIRCGAALCMVLAAAPACQWPGGGNASSPPSRLPADIGSATPLGAALSMLQAQLDSVLSSGLDDASPRRLEAAETISDRLLETRLPFDWISAESYSVEARLRQIQSMADRIGAIRVVGARNEEVLAEVEALRVAVANLRSDLVTGGSEAPPPVEQLLGTLDTTAP